MRGQECARRIDFGGKSSALSSPPRPRSTTAAGSPRPRSPAAADAVAAALVLLAAAPEARGAPLLVGRGRCRPGHARPSCRCPGSPRRAAARRPRPMPSRPRSSSRGLKRAAEISHLSSRGRHGGATPPGASRPAATTASPARHLPSVATPSRPDSRRRPGRSCAGLAAPSPTLLRPRPRLVASPPAGPRLAWSGAPPAGCAPCSRALAGLAPGARGHPGRRQAAASLLLRCRVQASPGGANRLAGRVRIGKQSGRGPASRGKLLRA